MNHLVLCQPLEFSRGLINSAYRVGSKKISELDHMYNDYYDEDDYYDEYDEYGDVLE